MLADSTAVQPKEMEVVLREIEEWVEKTAGEVSARASKGAIIGTKQADGRADEDNDDADEAESEAIRMLVEALGEVDVLVPRSRKKRPSSSDPLPLPSSLVTLYSSLLHHLADAFPSTFPTAFASHLASTVTSTTSGATGERTVTKESKDEETYLATLTGWLGWCLAEEGLDLDPEEREDIVKDLLLRPNPK